MKFMQEPTSEELTESIQSLTHYRDRLRKEVIAISTKLRISNQKINSSLDNHSELNKIESVLKQLIKQREKNVN